MSHDAATPYYTMAADAASPYHARWYDSLRSGRNDPPPFDPIEALEYMRRETAVECMDGIIAGQPGEPALVEAYRLLRAALDAANIDAPAGVPEADWHKRQDKAVRSVLDPDYGRRFWQARRSFAS